MRILRHFCNQTSGSVALKFGLAIIPILLFGALAVEFSKANVDKTKLQTALDSASIAAAALPSTTSDNERIALAQTTFAANMARNGLGATASFSVSGRTIQASATATMHSVLSIIVGRSGYQIDVATEVKLKADEVGEIALVLDYSSSMNGNGKWQAMRDAAIGLVNSVSSNGTKPGIKFGLVPFAKMVHTTLMGDYVVGQAPGSTWTGCTQDRKYPHNTTDNAPVSTSDETKWGLLPTAQGTCHQMTPHNLTIMRLSNNIPSVLAQLNAMDPFVGTHIALGLAWGWKVISPNAPYSDGVAYNTNDTLKAIVLLTDGEQTTKAWGPGDDLSKDNGETNLETMCANIKAKGVLLVTITFDLNDTTTKNRMRNCASSYEYYFDADDNGALAAAFEAIAKLLNGRLYVSK